MPEENPYKLAEVRARSVRDFFIHVAIFLPSALLLMVIAFWGESAQWGVLALLAVWGFGLLCHGVSLLNPLKRLSRLWDEDRLRRYYRDR